MFVADNGSSWFISGAPDNRWNNDDLHALGAIPGSDFEAVDESSLQVNSNSGQASGPIPITLTLPAIPSPTVALTGTYAPTNAITRETTELINKKSGNTNSSTIDPEGPRNMLPLVLGSVVAMLTLIVAGSRFLLTRKSRK